jgi:hypothetical protein
MDDLFERTGVRGFSLLSRGHPDDAALPAFAASGKAQRFILERLKIQPADLIRQFEQWSCTQDKGTYLKLFEGFLLTCRGSGI